MSLTIALIGRPNVGKSTLFNRLTKTRDAIVADIPGLTRDRQYGVGKLGIAEGFEPYYVVDSGGLSSDACGIESLMEQQALQAANEADVVLFIVDAREGLTTEDEKIASGLRQLTGKLYLVVNKTEDMNRQTCALDFFTLGLGEPYLIAAAHNQQISALIEHVLLENPLAKIKKTPADDKIKIAVIGRPNVGKSTLINRLLGEERLLAFDMPGTTRDSIEVEFSEDGKDYILVDTAGIRRRGKIKETIEKFSIIKAMQAVNKSQVTILVIDGREGFTDQDAGLLSMAVSAGRPLVLAINKWDGMESYAKEQVKTELDRRLHFIDFIPIHFISALHGSGIRDMFQAADDVYQISLSRISTGKLTGALERALKAHPPPLVQGHRIKLRYAHQGGQNPPVIVIHGNQADKVPKSYKRYLENFFREEFDLQGTPLKLEFKTSDNPYKDKKNVLNKRQIAKKKRLRKFNKKKR